jgi:hypothetical protein
VEDGIAWLNKAIPILDNQVLPAFRAIAILANIGMEEVGFRDDPG